MSRGYKPIYLKNRFIVFKTNILYYETNVSWKKPRAKLVCKYIKEVPTQKYVPSQNLQNWFLMTLVNSRLPRCLKLKLNLVLNIGRIRSAIKPVLRLYLQFKVSSRRVSSPFSAIELQHVNVPRALSPVDFVNAQTTSFCPFSRSC